MVRVASLRHVACQSARLLRPRQAGVGQGRGGVVGVQHRVKVWKLLYRWQATIHNNRQCHCQQQVTRLYTNAVVIVITS